MVILWSAMLICPLTALLRQSSFGHHAEGTTLPPLPPPPLPLYGSQHQAQQWNQPHEGKE